MESIYNSRNYYRLLNPQEKDSDIGIYNSRNYYRLLNGEVTEDITPSTTVEITIGYLTLPHTATKYLSTTVEITIGYLTSADRVLKVVIYNSRNYYRLLNISRMDNNK